MNLGRDTNDTFYKWLISVGSVIALAGCTFLVWKLVDHWRTADELLVKRRGLERTVARLEDEIDQGSRFQKPPFDFLGLGQKVGKLEAAKQALSECVETLGMVRTRRHGLTWLSSGISLAGASATMIAFFLWYGNIHASPGVARRKRRVPSEARLLATTVPSVTDRAAVQNPPTQPLSRPPVLSRGQTVFREVFREEWALCRAWLGIYSCLSLLSVYLYVNEAQPRTLGYVLLFNIGMSAVYAVSFGLVRHYAGRLSPWGYVWRVMVMMVVCGACARAGNPQTDSINLIRPSLLLQWIFSWVFYGALRRRVSRDLESP